MTTQTQHTDSPATEKQIAFLTALTAERDLSQEWDGVVDSPSAKSTVARVVVGMARDYWREHGNLTAALASEAIKATLAAPRKPKAKKQYVPVPEGIHYLDGSVYKVQRAVHGNGRLYAKRMVHNGDKGRFVRTHGVLGSLSEQTLMTLDDAKEYGQLYGMCCRCGATLTDETSIAEGVGPICATKF